MRARHQLTCMALIVTGEHGLAQGAGKTQTLHWIRDFFTKVCNWEHGREYVYLASQNTMAALINGFTLHSYHRLTYKQEDGTIVQKDDKGAAAIEYTRYQGLRWMFIDEFSTVGLQQYAEIDAKTRRHIRTRGTWALRGKGEDAKRPFGGLNVVAAGDGWQFGPIAQVSIFDNPNTAKRSSELGIAQMFWSKGEDSFNGFFELTIERRCKDPFLSHVLRGARHGNLDEETYCFLHGQPTEHPGSWDAGKKCLTCGTASCKLLIESWKSERKQGKLVNSEWLRRVAEECDTCAAERQRRCCTLSNSHLSPNLKEEERFHSAPYIHAFNEPKYYAALIRALRFGVVTKRVVIWFFAEDRPLGKNVALDQHGSATLEQWKKHHDRKTGGS